MELNPNDVAVDATSVRSSFLIPMWMDRQIGEIAARTLSTRSQVMRRLIAEGLEREADAIEAAGVKAS